MIRIRNIEQYPTYILKKKYNPKINIGEIYNRLIVLNYSRHVKDKGGLFEHNLRSDYA